MPSAGVSGVHINSTLDRELGAGVEDINDDLVDLVMLIENWGQDDPRFDIAPDFGDGTIDALDLQALMSYWGQEIKDPTLLAHWKLDETEGDVAYDSAAENDAVVMGEAVWQSEGGQIGGAIQLDGVDDYLDIPLVLNPKEGVFSIFAWIKGGEPGQAIISQRGGTDWLVTDAQGCLMTALVSGGRRPGDPLISETVVRDNAWHRIGLVWDSSYRNLYVDDEIAAVDAVPQNNFPDSQGGLYIGTANNRHSGTLWSGLIDDVRIYDRVIKP